MFCNRRIDILRGTFHRARNIVDSYAVFSHSWLYLIQMQKRDGIAAPLLYISLAERLILLPCG